jgi:predicted nucleotidyltransferase
VKLTANEKMLLEVAKKLPDDLREQVVFLGGSVVSLLLTDKGIGEVRTTQDVDFVIDVSGRVEFNKFEDRLRDAGFRQVIEEDAPICRWRIGNVKVDVMPCDEKILGFSNRWYKAAILDSVRIVLGTLEIKVVTAPYFLATKVEAFLGRGKGDFMGSSDMEDILTIIDGRSETALEIQSAEKDLQEYLGKIFQSWLQNKGFLDALPGHLPPDSASQERLSILLSRIKNITKI